MKIIFHEAFYSVYASDPAAESGRMEAVVNVLKGKHEFIEPAPASEDEIAEVHSKRHIEAVKKSGLYEISALAAGAAMLSAEISLKEPCFGLLRPPGHHASRDASWGFCYFNNMAVALTALKKKGRISTAFILDFDLHYGDGNVNILGEENWIVILNPNSRTREEYIRNVSTAFSELCVDVIGVSAGFDNHIQDWGGHLSTEDYETSGFLAKSAAKKCNAGVFGILEGGYNHDVLGKNVDAFISGLDM